ncbi:ribonuclease HI [Candidatus Arthromitus sp. SFB-rat-Yit]|nr:ribonuclease HI [Candidatus Arthromitus sp. SFB-rat-Yit]
MIRGVFCLAKKFYAIKKGYKIGIFESWDECKKNIDGYSGAVYKSFKTLDEAEKFLNDNEKSFDSTNLIAYVDGSYNSDTKEYSYGMVIINGDHEEHFCEKFDDKEMCEMRNVAGEIMGSMSAMKYCLENNFQSITICYDYEGIEKWCKGYWKANKSGTQNYKRYYDRVKDQIHIVFRKVRAHSGDKYNDLADKLAKKALDI